MVREAQRLRPGYERLNSLYLMIVWLSQFRCFLCRNRCWWYRHPPGHGLGFTQIWRQYRIADLGSLVGQRPLYQEALMAASDPLRPKVDCTDLSSDLFYQTSITYSSRPQSDPEPAHRLSFPAATNLLVYGGWERSPGDWLLHSYSVPSV